jgi:hypothetical protein
MKGKIVNCYTRNKSRHPQPPLFPPREQPWSAQVAGEMRCRSRQVGSFNLASSGDRTCGKTMENGLQIGCLCCNAIHLDCNPLRFLIVDFVPPTIWWSAVNKRVDPLQRDLQRVGRHDGDQILRPGRPAHHGGRFRRQHHPVRL